MKSNNGVAFSTFEEEDNEINQDDGIVRSNAGKIVKCFICGGNHFQSRCPKKPQEEPSAAANTTTKDLSTATKPSATSTIAENDMLVTASTNVKTGDGANEWDQNVDY